MLACAFAPAARASITIVYPPADARLAAVDSQFIFGSVTPASATLRINGVRVPVYHTGGFLAYLPVHEGRMEFECVASTGERIVRVVTIAGSPAPFDDTRLALDSAAVEPSQALEVSPGDVVVVRGRASPHANVWCTIGARRVDMAHTDAAALRDARVDAFADAPRSVSHSADRFAGSYVVQPGDRFTAAPVTVWAAVGRDTMRVRAAGSVSTIDPSAPRIAEFTDSMTVARTAPGAGYVLFAPRGVRATIAGRAGASVRLHLAHNMDVWVAESSVQTLPPGTLAPNPRIGTVRVDEDAAGAIVACGVSPAVAYRMEEDSEPGRLTVTFYGVTADIDWIRYNRPIPTRPTLRAYVKEVRWSIPSTGVLQMTILLNGDMPWGYHAAYADGRFTLRVARPPEPLYSGTIASSRPLAGLVIAIDAGHSPDAGAAGPTGLTESEANIAIARALGEKLASRGATIVYTRKGMEGVDLRRRVHIAVEKRADLLVSVHLNALPDGMNPFTNTGTSVYYYHPHSAALADAVHRALRFYLRLTDFGLYHGNLQLTRPTEMPAILTESTFLMHPEQEEWVRSGAGRRQIAEAITAGVESFVRGRSWRAR